MYSFPFQERALLRNLRSMLLKKNLFRMTLSLPNNDFALTSSVNRKYINKGNKTVCQPISCGHYIRISKQTIRENH